jgi:hypothetical protein
MQIAVYEMLGNKESVVLSSKHRRIPSYGRVALCDVGLTVVRRDSRSGTGSSG